MATYITGFATGENVGGNIGLLGTAVYSNPATAGVALVGAGLVYISLPEEQKEKVNTAIAGVYEEAKEKVADLGNDVKIHYTVLKSLVEAKLKEKGIVADVSMKDNNIVVNAPKDKNWEYIPLDNEIKDDFKLPPLESSEYGQKNKLEGVPLQPETTLNNGGIVLKSPELNTYNTQVKPGDVIDTPDTNQDIFIPGKNEGTSGFLNKEDGSWWEKDKAGSKSHGGSTWKRWPKKPDPKQKKTDKERRTLDKEGKVLRR